MKKKKKNFAAMAGLLLAFSLTFTACQLAVDEAVERVALTDPYISIQPASYAYFVDDPTYTQPTLSIEVRDWTADEGRLTYQWYTFKDIDDYVINGGTAIGSASGALTDKASYTPTLDPSKAGKYYFYVVVTNTNSSVNVGDNTGSIQSEVSIISFTAAGGALPPVISRHPGNAKYQAGRAVNSLTVRAAPRLEPDHAKPGEFKLRDALLSYQWYTLSRNTAADGTVTVTREVIPTDGTVSSYQPVPTALQFGKNYFYAVVTSTEGDDEASETSIPAVIEIVAGARAVAPVITAQPKDKMYFIGETVAALKVESESRDNGTLEYQWYSNNGATITATSGTAIADAKASTFTPPITTAAALTNYYYVVVTNTNLNVAGEKTAATTSKPVKVSVAAAGTPVSNATVTVSNPKVASNRYQYVRGYGGMDVAWANFPRTYQSEMELMYDPDRLGYNINRIMISPGKVNPSEGIQDLLNAHRPDYYENVKIVNKYGGYNLASPWSPPKEWKSNNSINGGGVLMTQYYQQFANYLKAFAQDMYDHGAPIYAISISNEPNYTAGYDGCEWEPDTMMEFYREVGRFTNGVRGYGGGKQIPVVLTVNGESANTPLINLPAMQDPVSRAAIDLLCRHVYGQQTVTLWRYGPDGRVLGPLVPWDSTTVNILDRGDTTKYEVWMTEHNINSANAQGYVADSTWDYLWRFLNDVDLVMRLNNENAFVWWASKRFYSMIGDGQYGTTGVGGTGNVPTVLPRGWGLSHYAKYTIDTHRIAATVSGTTANNTPISFEFDDENANVNNRKFSLDNVSPRITAYASITSGKDNAPINDTVGMADVEFISLVMWTPTDTSGTGGTDMGTIKIEMPQGFKIASYTAIKSTGAAANQVHQPYTVTIDPDRTAAYVELHCVDHRGEILSVKFIKE